MNSNVHIGLSNIYLPCHQEESGEVAELSERGGERETTQKTLCVENEVHLTKFASDLLHHLVTTGLTDKRQHSSLSS